MSGVDELQGSVRVLTRDTCEALTTDESEPEGYENRSGEAGVTCEKLSSRDVAVSTDGAASG